MLAVLDPLLLGADDPLDEPTLRELVRMMTREKMRIPSVHWYWPRLMRDFLGPLAKKKIAERPYLDHLDALRHLANPITLPTPPQRITVWHFRAMFQPLGEPWLNTLMRLVTGCALTGEPTALITRLIHGRNATPRVHGKVTLHEKTCWNLRLRPEGGGLVRVPCLCRARNLTSPWTCRYDERLPAQEDGGPFAFCPPSGWEKSSTPALVTSRSRPAWVDGRGSHWAQPSTGGGHHWDVYLEDPKLSEAIGLAQLNIVAWGAPPKEGRPGTIHHIPEDKKGRIKKTTGWV